MSTASSASELRLSPAECQFLLACVDGRQPGGADVRWPAIIQAARRHQVLPQLAALLDGASLDPASRAQLDESATRVRSRVDLGYRTFRLIMARARAQRVRAVVFKGPVLSELLYASPWMRAFADIDILVEREDIGRTEKLLQDAGFEIGQLRRSDLQWMVGRRPAGDLEMRMTPAETRALYLAHHCHLPYVPTDASSGLRVDLHWEVFPKAKTTLPAAHLMARAVPATIGGEEVETFSPSDTMLYLCVHVARDGYERLRLMRLADIVRSAARLDSAGWKEARENAVRFGLADEVYLALWTAHRALQHPLPAEALELGRHSFRRGALQTLLTDRALTHRDSPYADAAWELARGAMSLATMSRVTRNAAKQLAAKLRLTGARLVGLVAGAMALPTLTDDAWLRWR